MLYNVETAHGIIELLLGSGNQGEPDEPAILAYTVDSCAQIKLRSFEVNNLDPEHFEIIC